MQRVWQVGAGDAGRDFSRLCLDHDLMVLGPGRYGPFEADVYANVVSEGDYTGRKVGLVADFCQAVQPGHVVLLRRGQRAVALGIVANDDYQHDPTFDDIYGWDLEHSRAVIWQEHLVEDLKALQSQVPLFASRQMAMFPGVSRAGATILGGELLGVDRRIATEFSFYLAIPTMLGATVLDLYKARDDLTANGMGLMNQPDSRKYIVTGLVLLVAASVDAISRRRATASGRA